MHSHEGLPGELLLIVEDQNLKLSKENFMKISENGLRQI